MALVLLDRVQQTGTANTTVSFTLVGSVTGFQSFSVIGNTNTTYYSAFDASGNWEVGIGTYSTTGPTLTRTTILSSSNSGSAVTFSGTVNIFVTYPAGKSVNQDASGNVTFSKPLVLSGATSGSTTLQSTDATTPTITLPATTGTLALTSSVLPGAQAQVFTASGTFTIPTGVTAIKVTVVGAGGGGAGATAGNVFCAGGGGGYGVQYFTGLTPANTLTVTVGAAGTGGGGDSSGGTGGTSSIASGTQTITTASATGGGGGNATTGAGGTAGTVSGMAYGWVGGTGTATFTDGTTTWSGVGGAAGGSGGKGTIYGISSTDAGVVGVGPWGCGGAGRSATGANVGKGYGSGGGGAVGASSGAAGTAGIVVVEW